MSYLKLFIKKNLYLILYILYSITVIIIVPYFYYNNFLEHFYQDFENLDNLNLKEKNIIKENDISNINKPEKKLPFYDTKNPIIIVTIVVLIELACIYLK